VILSSLILTLSKKKFIYVFLSFKYKYLFMNIDKTWCDLYNFIGFSYKCEASE